MKERWSVDTTRIKLVGQGVFVGLLVGFVVSVFRLLIETVLEKVLMVYQFLKSEPIYLPLWIIFSILVAVGIGLLVRQEPNIKGSGIPQVEGQLSGAIELNWWRVLWRKFIGGVLAISSGLFLGREGPSIQLGAAVGQGSAKLFKETGSKEKLFLSSGASAGLAAAFNAPIAGVLFVLEEVYHHFSPLVWMMSLASAAAANMVSLYFFGLKPVLLMTNVDALPLKYYGHLVVLGILLGGFGYFYQRVLLKLADWYGKIKWLPSAFYGVVPFLLVIPIGLFAPQTLGGGNGLILAIAKISPTFWVLLGLLALRFVFSMISYGSGLPGGIFLPILTLGAITGACYGQLMVQMGLLNEVYLVNMMICAMAGYFSAIGKAPFTAMILVTEMVGSFNHFMPLAVVSLLAYLVVDMLGGAPIYESLLERLVGEPKEASVGKQTYFECPVFNESNLDGKIVRDYKWPERTLLAIIHRGEREIIPKGDTVIQAGDLLRISTDDGLLFKVREQIKSDACSS